MIDRVLKLLFLIGFLSGCATVNQPANTFKDTDFSDKTSIPKVALNPENDVTVILAFSGGGTRAAALSYGVLEELKRTEIEINGEKKRLLDEVDVISSVSGGSFTSAYYGVYGDQIFQDYKEDFLYMNVKDALVSRFLSPSHWLSSWGRTESASQYYQEQLFGDATLGDMQSEHGPRIIINASDITTGLRFSFIQEYFGLICSDAESYPVSKAVAASAAVPVLFEPVVLENLGGCQQDAYEQHLPENVSSLSYQSQQTMREIGEYSDKEKNKYIHLVDGGITDNLGLLAIYDLLELGQIHKFAHFQPSVTPHHVIVISVDASTNPDDSIGFSADVPTIEQTLQSVTDIQLHRYNDATKDLFKKSMERWAEEASSDQVEVVPHFIEVNFQSTANLNKRHLFNQVVTDLSLDDEVVDQIIQEGSGQLRNKPEFRELVVALN
ncbi:patatin-like phospholipase family protein [Vibrio ishigakensis]|nr:patatin-like phospholipase family protein [Vibrio ishigakensis]